MRLAPQIVLSPEERRQDMAPIDAQCETPDKEDIFAEQSRRVPRGPLDLVRRFDVRDDGMPSEALPATRGFLVGMVLAVTSLPFGTSMTATPPPPAILTKACATCGTGLAAE